MQWGMNLNDNYIVYYVQCRHGWILLSRSIEIFAWFNRLLTLWHVIETFSCHVMNPFFLLTCNRILCLDFYLSWIFFPLLV